MKLKSFVLSCAKMIQNTPVAKEQAARERADDINPRWLSVTQACKYTSMSDKTLMFYVKNGQIYGSRKGGKWYLDRFSIDAFFRSDEAFVRETVARIMGTVA